MFQMQITPVRLTKPNKQSLFESVAPTPDVIACKITSPRPPPVRSHLHLCDNGPVINAALVWKAPRANANLCQRAQRSPFPQCGTVFAQIGQQKPCGGGKWALCMLKREALCQTPVEKRLGGGGRALT